MSIQEEEIKKAPAPSKLTIHHIANEGISPHMAINAIKFSPVICGHDINADSKFSHAFSHIHRMVRNQFMQVNIIIRGDNGSQGWQYGIPLVLLHPEQLRDGCPSCIDIAREMNVLIVDFNSAETIFNLDITKAWEGWKKIKERKEDEG